MSPDTIAAVLREFYVPALREKLGDVRMASYDGKGYSIDYMSRENPDEPPLILAYRYKFYIPGPQKEDLWEFGTISITPSFLEIGDPVDIARGLSMEVKDLLRDWEEHRRLKLRSG